MSEHTTIEMPSGEKVVFVEDDHSYWRFNEKTGKRGRRLTGVTTACKSLDIDPSNLLKWAAKTQLVGAAEYIEQRVAADPASLPAVLETLRDPVRGWRELYDRQLTYDDVRDRAAVEGTRVHEQAMEALALGKPAPDTSGMSDAEKGKADAVAAFWFDHAPKVQLVEQIVYSERLGVAGRLDLVAELTMDCEDPGCSCHDDDLIGPGVIDLKTGGFISAAAHTQVGGGYPLLLQESGFDPVNWGLILQVKEDGTYDLIRATGTPVGFEIAVLNYREAGRINGAHRKARKARAEARQAVTA
jgi:hypothetical protein